jgi:hypothetical protein
VDSTRDFGWSASELIGDRLECTVVLIRLYDTSVLARGHIGPREPSARNYDRAIVNAIMGCGCEKRVVHLEDARASSSLRNHCSFDVQPVQ